MKTLSVTAKMDYPLLYLLSKSRRLLFAGKYSSIEGQRVVRTIFVGGFSSLHEYLSSCVRDQLRALVTLAYPRSTDRATCLTVLTVDGHVAERAEDDRRE